MKKLVCLALTTVLLLALCFALASCGECKEHEWDYSNGTTVPATCTENGKYVYKCTKCDATKDIPADPALPEDAALIATGHKKDASTKTETVAPTCTEVGKVTYDCMICGEKAVITEDVKATGHKFARTLSSADGKHFYACTVEGCSVRDGEEACEYETVELDATKHQQVCEVCETAKANSAADHTFGEPETVEATCSKAGSITKVCEDCGYEDITPLPMAEHVYDETAYGSDDEKHWLPCTACGAAKEGTEAAHELGEVTTTPPVSGSCMPGMTYQECETCGKKVVSAYIPSDTAHTFVYDAEASVLGDGKGASCDFVYTCSVCDFSYTIDADYARSFDDKEPFGDIWITASGDLSLSFADGYFALVGPCNAENNQGRTNAATSINPANSGITLEDNMTVVIGFDVGAPAVGYHETGWNLDIKSNNTWMNGQLKMFCDANGNLTFGSGGIPVGVATPGKMTNIVLKYTLDAAASTATADLWVNGEYKTTIVASSVSVAANGFENAATYMNITVVHSDAHVALDRGLYLDNIFVTNSLPTYLAEQLP